jgi:predicted nucleic acid-binding protein
VYLDTTIVVKLVTREVDSLHWAKLVDGQILFSSELMLTECFSALQRKEREGALTKSRRKRAWQRIEQDLAARRITLVAVSREVLLASNVVLAACHPQIALRSLDAIHLACAQRCQSWPLATNDQRMRQAADRLALPVAPLPSAVSAAR